MIKILPNRAELLKNLPSGGICAEVGVFAGEYSEKIIKLNKPKELHLIDNWIHAPWMPPKGVKTQKEFDRIRGNLKKLPRVAVHSGDSAKAAGSFADGYFDWVYIDASHVYKNVSADLKAYYPKIKPGGFLCGHDCFNHYDTLNLGSLRDKPQYNERKPGYCRNALGVVTAVMEIMMEHQMEMVYITADECGSFALQKI